MIAGELVAKESDRVKKSDRIFVLVFLVAAVACWAWFVWKTGMFNSEYPTP